MKTTLELVTAVIGCTAAFFNLKNSQLQTNKHKTMTEKSLMIFAIVLIVIAAIVAICYLGKGK